MFLFNHLPNPLLQPGKEECRLPSPGCWQLLIATALTGAVLASKAGGFKCFPPRAEASTANVGLGEALTATAACTWLTLPLKTWPPLWTLSFPANLALKSSSHCNQWWCSYWFNGGSHRDLIRKLVTARKGENAQQPASSLVGGKQRKQLSLRQRS